MEVIELIKREYAADLERDQQVRTADQVPTSYEAITAEWLTDVLCRGAPGARVVSFELGPVDDGSSNRRRITLHYNAAGEAAGLPATVFCKGALKLENRIILGVPGLSKVEPDFFNLVRPQLTINAPTSYYARFDPRNYAYLAVLNDIGGDVEFCDENTPIDKARAMDQVKLLAQLHSRFYASAALGSEALPFPTWTALWGSQISALDWEPFCDRAIDEARRLIPAGVLARRSEIWPLTIESVVRNRALPQTLTHTDPHLKNWYVGRDGRMGLSDWQVVCIGNWSRDFVYATTTSLAIEDRRAWLDDLLRFYLEEMRANGAAVPAFDQALQLVRQQIFTAFAYWTITLCPSDAMPEMQPVGASLKFIERMAAAIDDLDAFNAF